MEERSHARRYADYLQSAENAEQFAAAARDPTVRSSYILLAEGWRHLASQMQRLMLEGY